MHVAAPCQISASPACHTPAPQKLWCEGKYNIYDVLTRTVLEEGFVAAPTEVNNDDYHGRLMLLPGRWDKDEVDTLGCGKKEEGYDTPLGVG